MRPYFFQGIVGRSPVTESVTTLQKIRFENRFQDQECCHLDNTIPDRRDPQWPQLSIGFLDPYPAHRFRLVRFPLQCLLDLIQKSSDSALTFLDHLDRYAVHSGRTLIRFHPFPCRLQRVAPLDSVVPSVNPKLWLLLRFPAQLLSQLKEFPRHADFRSDFWRL